MAAIKFYRLKLASGAKVSRYLICSFPPPHEGAITWGSRVNGYLLFFPAPLKEIAPRLFSNNSFLGMFAHGRKRSIPAMVGYSEIFTKTFLASSSPASAALRMSALPLLTSLSKPVPV